MRRTQNNELYNFPSDKKKGIIGTVVFHIILAVVLIITGFHTQLPLPEEEGILVNFGTDDSGSGMLEPAASSSPQESSSSEESSADMSSEQTADEVQSEQETEETLMTQDFEEAPLVEEKKEQPDPKEEQRLREEAEAERIKQQELEEERLRKEAEEAEKKRLEEEQRRRTEIMNRTRNALENANARGSDTSGGEGIAGGIGNQGVETGSVDSKIYGEGTGTGTEGISYDLAGRQARSLPKPTYDIQSEGIVVVEVTVDRDGNVINANPGVKGSTTLEEYFLRVARTAAMNAKFDRKPDAPVIQRGTITYHFILR
ncbi:MAG: cell envelope integrity protein TolA [Bacteroidales bacterium]|nr:cell envelope integrity protein TolA [Bacteroidales bacterium]